MRICTSAQSQILVLPRFSFVGCKGWVRPPDAVDLWFKERVLDISGLDLNNSPEIELPELLPLLRDARRGLRS